MPDRVFHGVRAERVVGDRVNDDRIVILKMAASLHFPATGKRTDEFAVFAQHRVTTPIGPLRIFDAVGDVAAAARCRLPTRHGSAEP